MKSRSNETKRIKNILFLGILFGVAIRTKKPVAIPLAPIIWKLIVGEPVSVEDLDDTDSMYVQTLRSIRDIDRSGVTADFFHEIIPLQTFEGQSCTGKVRFYKITN